MDFPGTRARKTVYGAWHARLGSSEHASTGRPHSVPIRIMFCCMFAMYTCTIYKFRPNRSLVPDEAQNASCPVGDFA